MKKGRNKVDVLRVVKAVEGILPVIFLVFLIFGFEEPAAAVITIFSAILHEIGHIGYLSLARNTRISIKGVLSGFRINADSLLTYDEMAFAYLSGPLMNLFIFILSALLSAFWGELFALISIINLATAVSNLLPIEGYDGYGILFSLIQKREMGEKWLKALYCLSSALIFLLCIFSLYIIDRQGGGYWIFLVFFISMLKCIKNNLGE